MHVPMVAGNILLATMDAALRRDAIVFELGRLGADRQTPGLAAAVGLNQLLVMHGIGWDAVVAPDSLLVKLCGRLGSAFEAEREAAYAHALRFILRHRTTWSDLVRLPNGSPGRPPPVKPVAAPNVSRPSVPPLEEDWNLTVERLEARCTWRSDAERALLETLEIELASGEALSLAAARWLRDIWWWADLNTPNSGLKH